MDKTYNIAVLPGDGIGQEIIEQGLKVLNAVATRYNLKFNYTHCLVGGVSIEQNGVPITDETLEICKKADAIYFGSVGNPKFDIMAPHLRPEQALLTLRKELNLFANLRPVFAFNELIHSSTLKPEVIEGTDILIIRELTGGIYFGQPRGIETQPEKKATNTMVYTENEIKRIAKVAFEAAMKRNKKVCSVDKANVLEVSRLWREVVTEVAKEYPAVELTHMLVDNAAMQLIKKPTQFDIILTENMFGDILSDEAAMLTGSLGMLASASLSDKSPAMYEPSHGSAPDIANMNVANPLAAILSAAMMLKYSFNLDQPAKDIENAVVKALKMGYRTKDIYTLSTILVQTTKMGDLVAKFV